MSEELSASWWHRLRWTTCGICGREFRKGKGGGASKRVVCSEACFREAWVQWLRAERVHRTRVIAALTEPVGDE